MPNKDNRITKKEDNSKCDKQKILFEIKYFPHCEPKTDWFRADHTRKLMGMVSERNQVENVLHSCVHTVHRTLNVRQ